MPPKTKFNPKKNKAKKQQKDVKVPKLIEHPQNNPEEDVELNEEDLEFFREHGDFTGFLNRLDPVSLHKNEITRAKKPSVAKAKSSTDLSAVALSDSSEDEEEEEERENDRDTGYFDSDSDEEQEYEIQPRRVGDWEPKKDSKRLPIKLASGRIVVPEGDEEENEAEVVDRDVSDATDEEEVDEDDEMEFESELQEHEASEEHEKPMSMKEYIVKKKEELAAIAQAIMEDPENNIGQLKNLREISQDMNPKIKKLALLTQLAVYKDIIPGYRIRQLTEKEKAEKVSKEVKKLRAFEQTLLSNYQTYLQQLENELKNAKSKLKDKENGVEKTLNEPIKSDDASVAIECMCTLLTEKPHFNFRLNLMSAVIARMSVRRWNKVAARCCDAIIDVFKSDESGEASLDAVKLISKMAKAKNYGIHEQVLNTFLHLRLRDELNPKHVQDGENDESEKRGKKRKRPHMTRKQKKLEKERMEIQKEMREAEAVVDKEEREKRHSETLKLVFITYFRVLKNTKSMSPLLPTVLEGLATFAHLISVDFFGDLLEILKKIMIGANTKHTEKGESASMNEDEDNDTNGVDTRRSLLCILTAFQLLSGQARSLDLDLQDFYRQLYATLLPLCLNPHIETPPAANMVEAGLESRHEHRVASERELLAKEIEMMFFQKYRVPVERTAAFTKRMATACLQMPGKTVVSCLGLIKRLVMKHPKLDVLLCSEEVASGGTYLPYVDDPELCNPFATSLWELMLLQTHYNPKVRKMAQALLEYQRE
ncbi:uncharacterized protein VTP21DRAFT_1687 [Calcarisporiella thermophila]|uniref:uncharacterized protein n=1 Tax=Calcarisporiella thermophila TaxID=911321 RepID=UPI00374424A8